MTDLTLKIAYLYPDQLNIYGDRGNILTLYRRCLWRGIGVEITPIDLGGTIDPDIYDLYFMGGGQDHQQIAVAEDIHTHKAESLKQAVKNQAVFLTICGGYQLLGHYYRPHNGPELRGLSLIDAVTIAGNTRFIGNIVIERETGTTERQTIVGFENHSGLTTLGPDMKPLGRALPGHGHGNNGQDGTEGVCHGKLYGTYLHGSLLPKNPALADELIIKALQRRYTLTVLPPLDPTIDERFEQQAHQKVLALKP